MVKALKLVVSGRVQRVGYRRYIQELALELGLSGYVGNQRDGSVLVVVQGDEAKVSSFEKQARAPPPPASVKGVKEMGTRQDPRLKHFEIRFGSVPEELQEGFGAIQTEFQDYRDEFRGLTGDFKDYREEFKDYREEFRDYRQEFKDYRKEFGAFADRTDSNFKTLEQKYGEISEKLTSIMNALMEESRKSREMLEAMREDSRRTGEMLNESMRLLREAVVGMKGS